MNPADETAAKVAPTERHLAGAVGGSDDKLDEQLRVSVEALQHPSPPPKPVWSWTTFFWQSLIRFRSERQFIIVSQQ
jgi:hypothetical protein